MLAFLLASVLAGMEPEPETFGQIRGDYLFLVAQANGMQATFQRSLTDEQKSLQAEIKTAEAAARKRQVDLAAACKGTLQGLGPQESGDPHCAVTKN